MRESRYSVPDELNPGFEIIASLREDQIKKLSNTIKKLPRGVGERTFFKAISSKIDVENKEDLALTLFSLGALLNKEKEKDTKKIADHLTFSINYYREKKFQEKQLNQLTSNLISLFECCGNIKNTFKALYLQLEQHNVFRDSHLITDIRPVFGDNLDEAENFAIIFHKLRIEYEQNGKKNNFFVALDRDDLDNVREQIERAIKKESILQEKFKGTIKFINPMD
jgi:hypothetical protein